MVEGRYLSLNPNKVRKDENVKKIILTGITILLIIIIMWYYVYLLGIDTKYATKFSQVFGSYNIKRVDQFLNKETAISYRGITKTYEQLRNNVMVAFEERRFKMSEGSSYGNGNNKFVNGVQEIQIQSYVIYDDISYSVPITMRLKIKGINKFMVKSLSSDAAFFGYLFYRESIKNDLD